MGLFKFDIIFVILSVSFVMIGIHYLYDTIRRRYDILSKIKTLTKLNQY